MTIQAMGKKLEELEQQNKELRKMLKSVALLAKFAYNDTHLVRSAEYEALLDVDELITGKRPEHYLYEYLR